MMTMRKSNERGYADHGWLKSFHSFSFADYHDPRHMGFSSLRVINEDRIAPGTGFGTHGHRDMEIISYVLSGELAHRDSMGTGSVGALQGGVIKPGDVQRMSAGRGVTHSEFNNAPGETTHFLQIWLMPHTTGLSPSYEQKHFADSEKRARLLPVASPDARDGSIRINADTLVYAGLFDDAQAATLPLAAGRCAYVHIVRGTLAVNGEAAGAGDAVMLRDEPAVQLTRGVGAEVLVFDLKA
ncbi:MAG: pirin family protein [Burkholderiaceae bacterium]